MWIGYSALTDYINWFYGVVMVFPFLLQLCRLIYACYYIWYHIEQVYNTGIMKKHGGYGEFFGKFVWKIHGESILWGTSSVGNLWETLVGNPLETYFLGNP